MFETWEVLPYALHLVRSKKDNLLYVLPTLFWLTHPKTATISALRAFQAYVPSLQNRLMRILYNKAPQNQTSALAARQFGSWNLLVMVVQINAGINIHHSGAYNVALWAFAIQLVHFLFERVACGTVGGGERGLLAAEIWAFVGFVWMMVQREGYVDAGGEMYNPNSLWHPYEGQGFAPGPH
ncbi:Erg28-like protein [Teratosphaeria destructans]|uniref:Erg28-like protein n=1 Tax=Teratosphaeria destructans TaxID=418781 RepID=A0A9W7SLK4_9PEZI|nr:Erg28-like protein [Teratosphaeria destructans]